MRTGNIVKTYRGDIVIITRVSDEYIHWISASHSNCLGGTQILTTETEVHCDCMEKFDLPDIDCLDCNGTGKVKKIIYGMDKAIVLADNMFDYIKNGLLKNFDF